MSCGVGHRRSLDLVWLWCRQVATAPIRPLAWEPSYIEGAPPSHTKKPVLTLVQSDILKEFDHCVYKQLILFYFFKTANFNWPVLKNFFFFFFAF